MDEDKKFFVEGLRLFDCINLEDMMILFSEGIKNRKQGSHNLNQDSSRSHCLLIVYIIRESQNVYGKIERNYGKITFVDLAGSEWLKESGT